MLLGQDAAQAAEALTHRDSDHVEAGRQGTRGAAMIVGDERERRGDVTRLARTHQDARQQQFIESRRVRGHPRDGGPEEETPHDHLGAADPVGEEAAQWTDHGVDPEEGRGEQAELGVRHRNRLDQRSPHRREHDAVEVVEAADDGEKGDDEPGAKRRRRGIGGDGWGGQSKVG